MLLSYLKQTRCKNVLHKRREQLGFHFLILFLKHGKELEYFIFCGIKCQIFEDKNYAVSVPYLSVFGFLADNLLRIDISITLKTSSHIVGKRSCRYS